MFAINVFCKELIFSRRSYAFISCIGRLFSTLSPPSTKRCSTSVYKNEYIKYIFSNCSEPKSAIEAKRQQIESSFTVIPNIVSVDEESRLVEEIEKSLKRLRYQHDHWDDAIHGYRETEITLWKDQSNSTLIKKLKSRVFTDESTTKPMQNVHILDLCDNGYVKPHVDSVRFCGNIIGGLSLLSDSVMRLAEELNPDAYSIYAVLPRRSLYIMKNNVRYQYTHEILSDGVPSVFSDRCIVRQRRISIVMRNEPPVDVMK